MNRFLLKSITLLAIFFVLFTPVFYTPKTASAQTVNYLNVPGGYPTIQSAINAAQTGDIVEVSAGTYNEAMNLSGKTITVRGAGVGQTILNGTGLNDSLITATSGETTSTIIEGFTITNGQGKAIGPERWGSGAYIENSSPTLRNIAFMNNTADWGAAISFENSTSVVDGVAITGNNGRSVVDVSNSNISIKNSTISDNSAVSTEGLIRMNASGGVYDNVVIENNNSSDWSLISVRYNVEWGTGGLGLPLIVKNSTIRNNSGNPAIEILGSKVVIERSEISGNHSGQSTIVYNTDSFLEIYSSTIANNSTGGPFPAAINNENNDDPESFEGDINILNSIFWGNTSSSGLQITLPGLSGNSVLPVAPMHLNYSIIQGGWPDETSVGIIDADPLFADYLNGDYHLTENSPAIDTGDPNSLLDSDGTRADIGGYPFLNHPPVVGEINAPIAPVLINTNLSASADFTDADTFNTHIAVWNWGDGVISEGTVSETSGSGSVTGNHTYTSSGIYTVTLTVVDNRGLAGQSIFHYVVVYDPNGEFVTGGGWINSPAGAYTADPALTGRANFGFNSKYESGTNVPTGQTQFNFKVAEFNFHGSIYDWLVISGPRAQYKGSGTVNGGGNYGFILTGNDGQSNGGGGLDKFRIKIWDKTTGGSVYDNQLGDSDEANASAVIEAGNILIH